MDNIDDLHTFLRLAYQHATPYIWPLLTYTNTLRSLLTTQLLPLLRPLLLSALNLASQSPALGLILLLATLFIGFKIMSFTQRVMGYVTFLLLRLGFWAALALCLAAVWQRGVERTVREGVEIGMVLVQRLGEEPETQARRAGGGGGKGKWS